MQLYMIINLYIYIVGNNNLKYIVKYCYSKVLLLFLLGSVSWFSHVYLSFENMNFWFESKQCLFTFKSNNVFQVKSRFVHWRKTVPSSSRVVCRHSSLYVFYGFSHILAFFFKYKNILRSKLIMLVNQWVQICSNKEKRQRWEHAPKNKKRTQHCQRPDDKNP
jgi:hypothetical protein